MSTLTERAMAASLKKLLEKKTLDKIIVKDITDDCGVNRQTFYYHFHDIYDLVEWIFTEEAARFKEEFVEGQDWRYSIEMLLEKLLEDKTFIMNVFYSLNRRQLDKFLQELIRPTLSTVVRKNAEGLDIDEEDIQFIIGVFSSGLVGWVIEWVSEGMKVESQKNIEKYFMVIEGTLSGILEQFVK